MSDYKYYIIFVSMMATGLAVAFCITQGYYPIALVGGDFVSARSFSEEYRATDTYYQNFMKTYQAALKDNTMLPASELEADALDNLIEKDLIKDGAEREAGTDLNMLVQSKLSGYSNDADLVKAGLALYGLDRRAFWNKILVPQATREILQGRLFLKGQNIDDWLVSAKKSAHVLIFSPNFSWDGEKVSAK
jgi:hypothetical protein